LAFSLLAARFIYGPINTLLSQFTAVPVSRRGTIDEVSLLDSALAQTKRLCLSYLLLEKSPEEPFLATLLSSYERNLVSPWFRVCIVKIDGYGKYCRDCHLDERDAHQIALCDSLLDIFRGTYATQVIVMEENETVLLLGSHVEEEAVAVIAGLRELQKLMIQYCRLSISAGVGPIVSDVAGIGTSYRCAREAVSHRYFLGKGSIVDYTKLTSRMVAMEPYPKEMETKIIEALSVGRPMEAISLLEEFRRFLSRMPLDRANAYSTALALRIERQFVPSLGKAKGASVPDLTSLENVEEVIDTLRHYCLVIATEMKERNARRGGEIVARLKRLIDEKYHEPTLNLDVAADIVARSPSYVGRIFKMRVGCSFANHLNKIRMDKARELLESTNLAIGVIAKRIGVSNATYLFTLFKKSFAETPNHYRERCSVTDVEHSPSTLP
jgi:two-component system response regulator YesN